ncbi:hypothetical protein AB0G05_09800 [Nonomuraea wenchangensis]
MVLVDAGQEVRKLFMFGGRERGQQLVLEGGDDLLESDEVLSAPRGEPDDVAAGQGAQGRCR